MPPVTDELLQQMTDVIVKAVKPRQVILFGSRATGSASIASDVDLLVVVDGPFGPQNSRRCLMAHLSRLLAHLPVAQDILLYTSDEVEHWRGSLNHVIGRALREGKLLYERA
jgi:predicted nucleotidyltransferase